MKSSTIGEWTKRELARIFMTYGVGADALRDLGISQEQFWRLAKRPAKQKDIQK